VISFVIYFKKFIKSPIKVILFFICLFLTLVLTLASGEKLAEYRANRFCEKAMNKQSLAEIKILLAQTKNIKNNPYLEQIIESTNTVVVDFSSFFGTSYICLIELDFSQNQRPIKSEVIFKD